MRTLRKGDTGDDVVTLQKSLRLFPDGIFGKVTEDAVRAFQRSKGLTADGVVGAKTWAALGVTYSKCVDPSLIYAPLSCCVTKSPKRAIKYLAIHYTAGGSSKGGCAKSLKSIWENAKRASADFGVDDRDMVQFNPDLTNYYCWSVGDKKNPYSGGGSLYGIARNSNTISIEICSSLKAGYNASVANHDGWYFTDAALANAAKLAKMLMAKYNIPIERVKRHFDISGKICPGVVGWTPTRIYDVNGKPTSKFGNENEWLKFKEMLK